jgi:hypothetical protein
MLTHAHTHHRCLVAIVDKIMPQGYYVHPMVVSRADQRAVQEVIHTAFPSLAEVVEKHEIDLSLVTFQWFFTLFVDCVPTDVNVRIWDWILLRGHIALYHFALAIFRMNEAKILNIEDRADAFNHMRSMGRDVKNIEEITQIARHETV